VQSLALGSPALNRLSWFSLRGLPETRVALESVLLLLVEDEALLATVLQDDLQEAAFSRSTFSAEKRRSTRSKLKQMTSRASSLTSDWREQSMAGWLHDVHAN